MKIVFLHLSDLHLRNGEAANPIKIQAAVKSLSVYEDFDGVVLIVSGDIASTGAVNDYKMAEKFLGRFVDEIKGQYTINDKNVKILLVPGNHDIDYAGETRPSPETIRTYISTERDYYLCVELNRMRNYFSFSDKNNCFFAKKYMGKYMKYSQFVTRKILTFEGGYQIEANLINSAPFSCDSDDGLHCIPDEAFLQISAPSDANLSILVMHHSPDWFEFSQRLTLRGIITQRCSVVFCGHEHNLGSQTITTDDSSCFIKQSGGIWWQQSVPNVSQYYASLFDTDDRSYSQSRFEWDDQNRRFVNQTSQDLILTKKALNGQSLICCEDYLCDLMSDNKHSISKDITDYCQRRERNDRKRR